MKTPTIRVPSTRTDSTVYKRHDPISRTRAKRGGQTLVPLRTYVDCDGQGAGGFVFQTDDGGLVGAK